MTLHRLATLAAAVALTVGLIGAGVGASYSDNATAQQNVSVGTFGIEVSSTAPGAVVSPDKHSVTFAAPMIVSSAASSVPFPFTIKNIGSMGTTVTVTMTTPADPFTSLLAAPVAAVYLVQDQTHDYAGGLQWPMLVNDDLAKVTGITYTAVASEGLPPVAVGTPTKIDHVCGSAAGSITIPAAAHVDYVVDGVAKAAGTYAYAAGTYVVTAVAQAGFQIVGYPAGGWSLTIETIPCPPSVEFIGAARVAAAGTITYPTGTQPGDLAIAMATRWGATSNSLVPSSTGFTKIGNTVSSLPGTYYTNSAAFYRVIQPGDTATAAWLNAHDAIVVVYRNASIGSVSGSTASIPALSLQVTNGSSWVAGLVSATTGATATGMTVRTSTGTGSMSALDTNTGVSSWASHATTGQHKFAIELKAQ